MPESRTIVLEGVSRLQFLELQAELGPEVIRSAASVPGLTLGALSDDTVVILMLTLPIAKAIARVIARDKVSFIYRSWRPDGTSEESKLTITRPASAEGSEEQIVKQLMTGNRTDEAFSAE